MSSNNKLDYVLLSKLIEKLKSNDYYRTYAKSLALTENSSKPIPSDDELVAQMFHYFIQNNLLQIYHEDTLIDLDYIESEVDQRAQKYAESWSDDNDRKNTIRDCIWDNEIYIKIKELKKLYANKCIVFPSSLLSEFSKR